MLASIAAWLLIVTITVDGQAIQLKPYIVRGKAECFAAGMEFVKDYPGNQKFTCMPARMYLANHG